MKYNILCTICARGGSKGVKNKNIRPLAGKPLIAHTIEQALRWGKARHVIVSTDSKDIADVARACGAEVPFMRPARLATDNAPKVPSIRHALIESEKIFKEKYNIVIDLDVSAPLRRIKDIDNCLKMFLAKRPKTLFSVTTASKNPYFNMCEKRKDGFAGLSKELLRAVVVRQKAPKVYSMNGSIYIYSRDFLLDPKNILPFSGKAAMYVMNEMSARDIDTETDFKFIEFLVNEGIWKND
ncbi:MAG: acylneuraminate cytidylyltransferase family protein [Candidatus Omnitrophica bacterium]|nr:acylneuraminate cytidylyltransferase family protein [Candidatus Omnitrophota bacterium]